VITPRASHHEATRMIPLLRALALLGLLLLPIQMRAGAQHPHPHALLHLLVDASDGAFDHHTLGLASSPTHHDSEAVGTAVAHHPDIPTVGQSISAAGGLVALAAVVAALIIPPPVADPIWPRSVHWRDRLRTVEPPPPRTGCV
jgi:hypothetical protein